MEFMVIIVLLVMVILKNSGCLFSCLLSLEGLMLMVLYMCMLGFYSGMINYSGLSAFLYMMVVEAALGLSLLVMYVRGNWKDVFFYHSLV